MSLVVGDAQHRRRGRTDALRALLLSFASSQKLTVALEDSDDRFLPSSSSTGQESDIQRSRDDLKEGEMYLSSEVRALMAQYAPPPPSASPFLSLFPLPLSRPPFDDAL